jgi:putative ABC transport system substrate-binding protein
MSYAADTSDQFARAASYVHRILQGENPAELPVEQATRFELYLNQKAAGELGVSLPRSLLLRANLVD